MTISNTIALLGGLGFFLFGMSLLGEGLKRVAGSKLEIILEKLTSTTFRGVLLGSLVTAVIQSSSATTVMVVGFVNSGIMKLTNAIGIIMGANIGTTATGWLLVLSGIDCGGLSSATIFAFVAFVGIILYFFCKDTTKKNVGMILLALSVLMSGMQSMSAAMSPLKESPAFLNFISAVSNPLVAIAVGIVVTAIIQSCSASIGILQALSVTGVISYEVAVPMVLGMCIGACVPVLLSAIGANINGKRTAFIYLYFNLAGSFLLMIPFYLIHSLIGLDFMAATATSMGIAIVNTVYKVLATVLLTPCAPLLEKQWLPPSGKSAVPTMRRWKNLCWTSVFWNILRWRWSSAAKHWIKCPTLPSKTCGAPWSCLTSLIRRSSRRSFSGKTASTIWKIAWVTIWCG
jgi:phosphate:Na+ symporter